MRRVRTWHWFLFPVPVVGWWLLLAYFLDDWASESSFFSVDKMGTKGEVCAVGRGQRIVAGAVDFLPLLVASIFLSPVFAWILGSGFLLFRDAGRHPWSLGKRLFGFSVTEAEKKASLSFTESFSRNLPLLLPYIGPLIEAALLVGGKERLGDRLAGTRVGRLKS